MSDIGEIDLTIVRLQAEEKCVLFLYDDATDLPVKAPVGNATFGYGCNVQKGVSQAVASLVLKQQVIEARQEIMGYPWFYKCNAARRSVLIDITFNGGLGVMLEYKLMEAAIMADDWKAASVQCHSNDPRLAKRYAVLAQIMLSGVA